MSLINENPRISDAVLWESGETIGYTRDNVTLLSGTLASPVGQVLGQIALGAATSATKSGGNTGTGTLTLDATTPILAFAIAGAYTVTVLATGRVQVTDPHGKDLGEMEFGAGATITWSDQIKFALADNSSTHFAAGDGFVVTITAGSGKYVQVAPAALDGSQNAAAVLLTPVSATLTADESVAALTRGPAILKSTGLTWTSGMSGGQITAATAQLQALGITTRTAYGV